MWAELEKYENKEVLEDDGMKVGIEGDFVPPNVLVAPPGHYGGPGVNGHQVQAQPHEV